MQVTVERCNLTKPDDIEPFRSRFDIVTCNDVIEHVLDPLHAIRNVADMLVPGGLAYFEIPNARFPGSIAEDIHFHFFGITLLDHEEAKEYFTYCWPGFSYSVGHYLELSQFISMLEEAGMASELIENDFAGVTMESVRDQIELLRNSYHDHLDRVPEPMRARVKHCVERYLEETAQAPLETPEERCEFIKRYGISVWKVLGRKCRSHASNSMGKYSR